MKKFTLIFLVAVLSVGLAFGQSINVTGTVKGDDGSPLAGATVVVKGTHTGTVTDGRGSYTITAPATSSLIVTYIGMSSVDVAINGRKNVNVTMTADNQALEEVVVTGYGTITKKAFTGSATVVKPSEITSETNANFVKSMQGVVPGMQVNIGSGQPGSPVSVSIRGMNSITAGTAPLYVVDGVPLMTTSLNALDAANGGMLLSPLSMINPADIESMTVLKDATATSIYGSRASNGVIVITTKSGKSGALQVNVSARAGVSTPARVPYGARQVGRDKFLKFGAALNGITVDEMRSAIMDEGMFYTNPATNDLYDVDWWDAITRTGATQEYNVSLQGGGGNGGKGIKYYVSGGFYDESGIVIGRDLNRYSGRVNLSQSPNKHVTWGVNASASYSKTNNGPGGGFYSDPVSAAQSFLTPLMPIKTPDGYWNFENGVNPIAQYAKPDALNPDIGDIGRQQQYKFSVAPYITINFLRHLSFTSKFGIDYYDLKETVFNSVYNPDGMSTNGYGSYSDNNSTNWVLTNILRYANTFCDKHTLSVMLGQEAQRSHLYDGYAEATQFPRGQYTLNSAAVAGAPSTSYRDYALASYFLNAEYDYANKYYLSGSLRYDGSSRVGRDNRYAPFWSVGAKWRITQEEFMMSSANWLRDMTLRVSYGTTGNQEIDWYASRGLITYGYDYNKKPGFVPTQVANNGLKWEQTNKFNVGLDLNFADIISVSADFYNDATSNMIFSMPQSFVTGNSSSITNIGKMRNTGVEIAVLANIISKSNFSWTANANATFNKNKVVKLSTKEPILTSLNIREEGRPYYQWYMKEWAGANPENGEPLWYMNETGNETTNDYNKAARRYLGAADPKVYGGFGTTFKAFNFDLNITFNYKLGGKVYADALNYIENGGESSLWGATTNYIVDNAWTTPGQITNVPKLVDGGNGNASSVSSRYLMNGSYLKLKNITLGYTLPSKITRKMLMKSVRFYVSADNTWTVRANDFRAIDPETTPDGVIWFNYPMPANVMFGINVSF